MKQGLSEFEKTIDKIVGDHYSFEVCTYRFIPVGDSAYSYVVENPKHELRYLKVFNAATRKGVLGVKRLHRYLPLMEELVQNNLFPELPRPYRTLSGTLQFTSTHYTCAMFDYVEGKTLANAYPFSDEIQWRLAGQLAKLHSVPLSQLSSHVELESFSIDFPQNLHGNLKTLESYAGDDPFVLALQSLVLPKRELINRFWEQLCEFQTEAIHSKEEFVLCHGDLWGGNIIDLPHKQPVFLDWESSILAPKERDLFLYIGSEYKPFQNVYAEVRRTHPMLNPKIVGFYAYRQQLSNLTQWMYNLIHENFGDEQKHNDLEMIEFHCLNRWSSIESTITALRRN